MATDSVVGTQRSHGADVAAKAKPRTAQGRRTVARFRRVDSTSHLADVAARAGQPFSIQEAVFGLKPSYVLLDFCLCSNTKV